MHMVADRLSIWRDARGNREHHSLRLAAERVASEHKTLQSRMASLFATHMSRLVGSFKQKAEKRAE